MKRLEKQINFIIEIDKLKSVLRRSYLCNGERHENSAEHSWHLALMALILHEYANEPVDLLRVLKMVLIHDIVEIDAGDTYFFDEEGNQDKLMREQAAAARLFHLLPSDQATEYHALWEEFETMATPDARFASAVDRLIPLFHNYHSGGRSWREHDLTDERVTRGLASIGDGSTLLWEHAQDVIAAAVEEGILTSGANR